MITWSFFKLPLTLGFPLLSAVFALPLSHTNHCAPLLQRLLNIQKRGGRGGTLKTWKKLQLPTDGMINTDAHHSVKLTLLLIQNANKNTPKKC